MEIMLGQVSRKDDTFQISVDREQVRLRWWAHIPASPCLWRRVEIGTFNDTCVREYKVKFAMLLERVLKRGCKVAVFGHIGVVEHCPG